MGHCRAIGSCCGVADCNLPIPPTGRLLLAYPSPTEELGVQGYLTLDLTSCQADNPSPSDCSSASLNPWYDPTANPPAILYNPTDTSDRMCSCGTVSELYIMTTPSVKLYDSAAANYVADIGVVCTGGAHFAMPMRPSPPLCPSTYL